MSEHDLQTVILKYLKDEGIFCWRSNVGRKGYMTFGLVGSSDITGLLKNGRRLEIEVKDAKGKVSEAQQKFINTINENGGLAFVARDLETVKQKVTEL